MAVGAVRVVGVVGAVGDVYMGVGGEDEGEVAEGGSVIVGDDSASVSVAGLCVTRSDGRMRYFRVIYLILTYPRVL